MTPGWRRIAALLVWLGVSSVAAADEVLWRYDYQAARQEAQRAGRPLFLDIATEWCGPCRKLEATTFRDPAVVRTLNEQFIPLKLDGGKEKALVEALRVQGFPTLILAAPSGQILQRIEGYVEAAQLREQLRLAAASLPSDDWMTRSYHDAAKAAAAADFPRAVALLRPILEDGQSRPVQQSARTLLTELEQRAGQRYAEARQLTERGQYRESMDTLTEISRQYEGTQVATVAAEALNALAANPEVKTALRRQQAAELMVQVRQDHRVGQWVSFLDRCQTLTAQFADLPEGAQAGQIIDQLKNEPETLKAACEAMGDRLADLYLAQADAWVRKGQPGLAVGCLERVLALMPGSRYAALAKARLAELATPTSGSQP